MNIKKIYQVILFLLFGTIFSVSPAISQEKANHPPLLLRDSSVGLEWMDWESIADQNPSEVEIFESNYYRLVQFESIPKLESLERMQNIGLQFLEYIPQNTYLVAVPSGFNWNDLKPEGLLRVHHLTAELKIDKRLKQRPIPAWATNGDNIRILLEFQRNISGAQFLNASKNLEIIVLDDFSHVNKFLVEIPVASIDAIAHLAFVRFLDLESEPGEPESDDGRNLHRANLIDRDYPGAYEFDGSGVSVAINDDGFAGPHIDFKGRSDQSDVINDLTGNHGDMTVGIVGGAGNLDPTIRGMATGSFLWVRAYNQNLPNTINLHQNEAVMTFSSSYSNGCNAGYTSIAQTVDAEIYAHPSLIQVFSAGNNNGNDCDYGAGNQWGNITGGHKMGKNAIAVANLNQNDLLESSSSRGPASDGRIKPDIAAHGNGQWSTDPNNSYAIGGGTSAAAPGIAGVLTQMHQAYRIWNNGDNAPSALLKAALLNTANDMGNPGPDFRYGFGKVNAWKALRTIEENRYWEDTISQASVNSTTLAIPANVAEVRVMLYWHDVEGSTSAQFALVNNLDLKLINPTGATHLPLILDHTPNPVLLDLPATPGVDSINNVEQVRVTNPIAGNYSVQVNGTTIPFGNQTYFIVYEFLYDEIMLTYPVGGEGLPPGSDERIHWDAFGNAGTFSAEVSFDNGSNWELIQNGIPGNQRFISYTVPDTVSLAKVRVSRGIVNDISDASFSIIPIPEEIQVAAICSTSNEILVVWNAVNGATSYDVFYLGEMYMDSVGNTTLTNYYIPVTNLGDEHWVSVRARGANGEIGRRANAVMVSEGNCMLDCISDDDAGILSIISPQLFNESCIGQFIDVEVLLTNIGPNVQTGFPVYYQLANNPAVVDTFLGSLVSGSPIPFIFNLPIDFQPQGTQSFKVWTGLSNDGARCNDTLEILIDFFETISTMPYMEDFESGIFPPQNMWIDNPDGQISWSERQVIGATGSTTNAAYMNNFNYNNSGAVDFLNIVSFDFSSSQTAVLTFDLAYVMYSTALFDGLRVEISVDCGDTFISIWEASGVDLATSNPSTSNWLPSSSNHWRQESISLYAFLGGDVKIRFVAITGYGNNLYLDNIQIESMSQAPTSAFTANIFQSCSGIIQFSDLSTNFPENWLWDFGDNITSTLQNPLHQYSESGVYDVSLITSNLIGSDTLSITAFVEVQFPVSPFVNDTSSCDGAPIEIVPDMALDEVNWYSNGDMIHVGSTYLTPSITSDLSLELQNVQLNPLGFVGPSDNSIGPGSIHTSSFVGTINFEAYSEFYFVSAWVSVQTAGIRTFSLWDAYNGSGNVIQEIEVNIPAGSGRIELGFHIPGAGSYSIGGSNVNMYRNSDGAVYPYEIPGIISITGSSAITAGNYYYYLYDLEVELAPCHSPTTTILVQYVTVDFDYIAIEANVNFIDNTIGANTYLWDFGDGNSSTEANPNHTYATPGTYEVELLVNGSCSNSRQITLDWLTINSSKSDFSIEVYPNPAHSLVQISSDAFLKEDALIRLFSADGKMVHSMQVVSGISQVNLDLSNYAPGIYQLIVTTRSEQFPIKLVVVSE